tara:strand:+ start:7564 stop:8058 length:495 start_codon:yes stop_codon:yes gene_type:complete
MIKKINYLFVTMFGIGNISRIPGSIASLITVLILLFVFNFLNIQANYVLFIIIIIFIVSIFSINIFIKEKENKDPKEIVIDEFVGQSIPICLYEVGHSNENTFTQTLTIYFIMFILFRLFDIIKPYPVSYYDKNFKNGFGVVMDDVCAGLYVVVILVLYMTIFS